MTNFQHSKIKGIYFKFNQEKNSINKNSVLLHLFLNRFLGL